MRKTELFFILLVSLPAFATARGFIESMPPVNKKIEVETFLTNYKNKVILGDARSLASLKGASRNSIQEGDVIFPYRVVLSYLEESTPEKLKKDSDGLEKLIETQEELVEVIIERAKDEKNFLSNREIAVHFTGLIAESDKLASKDFNEKATEALAEITEGDNLILGHIAAIHLGRVVGKHGEAWADIPEDAANAMVTLLNNDELELKKIAFLVSIKALEDAKFLNSGTEKLWEELADGLSKIKSPAHQALIRVRMNELVDKKRGSAFHKFTEQAKKQIDKLKSLNKTITDSSTKILKSIGSESDPAKLESSIEKILKDAEQNPSLQFLAFTTFAQNASLPSQTAYKERLFTESMIKLTHRSHSPLFFTRSASVLLGLVLIHKDSVTASIPLVTISKLLSSTDAPAFILPIIAEIQGLLYRVSLPAWIQKRLLALVFLQAGDAVDENVRKTSFNILDQLARRAQLKAVKWAAVNRIDQLARYAKDENIKKLAAEWK